MVLKAYVELGKACIAGFLGASLFILIYQLYASHPQIGSVNINNIVNEHIKMRANSPLSAQELQADSYQFMTRLERVLQDLSKKQHSILIVSDAVIAGATDYTETIRRNLEKLP